MDTGLVSVFALSWERAEMAISTMQKNIAHAENFAPMELLVCDQGSKDRRAVEWFKQNKLTKYLRENQKNEGVGHAFNQLYLRSSGEYLCFLGTDLLMPRGWLKEMLGYVRGIPNPGMVGMDWGHGGIPPLTQKFGSHGHWLDAKYNRVFGAWIMHRNVVETIGLFHEGFDVYGLEDSDFNERVNRSGFNSLYVPNTTFKCQHIGVGEHDAGEYRQMKNLSMAKNLGIFQERVHSNYKNGLREPLPPMREPVK